MKRKTIGALILLGLLAAGLCACSLTEEPPKPRDSEFLLIIHIDTDAPAYEMNYEWGIGDVSKGVGGCYEASKTAPLDKIEYLYMSKADLLRDVESTEGFWIKFTLLDGFEPLGREIKLTQSSFTLNPKYGETYDLTLK